MRKSTAQKDLMGPHKTASPNVGLGLGSPGLMAMKTCHFIACQNWSKFACHFIVLNNFFANVCVKKNCASPTKSFTARHCSSTLYKFIYFMYQY